MTIEQFYMQPINWAKVWAVWLADTINKLWDPFQPHSEDPITTDLAALEALFNADIEARFVEPSGEFLYQRPRPSDAGDTALFQGLFTGCKIMANADVTNQVSFINTLFKNGVLIRGYYPNGEPNDTTSNDSATGMLFFFYSAIRWGNATVRAQAGALLRLWLNSLLAHGGALVNLTGQVTDYGALDNGVMTDPLRVTLYLALLSLGMLGDDPGLAYHTEYARVYNLYRPILKYPKVKLLWWDTDYDSHRAAIHLHVLNWSMKDSIYADGLVRIWRILEKTNNAWIYSLCRDALPTRNDALVGRILGSFSFAKRQLGNVQNLNPSEPSVWWPPQLPSWLQWLGTPSQKCRYALPFYKRGSQDFFWQRGPYSLNEWVGNVTADTYHTGLDVLICGWLASRLGIL